MNTCAIPITFFLPVATPSPQEFAPAKIRRQREAYQRMSVIKKWDELGRPAVQLPLEVHLVRVAETHLIGEELHESLSPIAAALHACFGVDNNDSKVRVEYQQEQPRGAEIGVRVSICDLSAYRAEQHEDIVALARTLVEHWPQVDLIGPPEQVRIVSSCIRGMGDALIAGEEFES